MKISIYRSTLAYTCKALLLLTLAFVTTGCGGGDDPVVTEEDCAEVTKIEGSSTVAGETQDLIVARFTASSPGASFDDRYGFYIISVDNDCSEFTTLTLNFDVAQGSEFGGTFQIADFFSAEAGNVYGRVMRQQVEPVTISSFDLDTGTVSVINNGDNNFTLSIDATLVGGASLDFEMTHSF